MTPLPIAAIVPAVRAALAATSNLVVSAPPASGKTTVLPLELATADWLAGRKILMLEPRRLACVAAARRLAAHWHETPGGRVGYRTRLDSRPGSLIEVVTEGILTRMIQHDPELSGVGLVIFDEFHERHLAADLGLALTLDLQSGWRDDLRILVMSATLETAAVSRLLRDAPVIQGAGALHPVRTCYRPDDRPRPPVELLCDCVRHALHHETGSILAFLPGEGEIRRAVTALSGLPADVQVMPLYGRLAPAEQQAAIEPCPPGVRKVVLATNIAESSLTIEGVRVVIDSGLERRSEYHPGTGMNHLVTAPISQAAADQRRGRAGRNEPGVCFRLWSADRQQRLAPAAPPEICATDLTGLALELAAWGVTDPAALRWLDPPPAAHWQTACGTLTELRAIDNDGRLTDHGKQLHRTGLHPRIAQIVALGIQYDAGLTACRLAAILTETDARSTPGPELEERLYRANGGRVGELAAQLARRFGIRGGDRPELAAELLAAAFFDRIARRRSREPGERHYRLTTGRGAWFREPSPLMQHEFLVTPELAGGEAESEIRLAIGIAAETVLRQFSDRLNRRLELEIADGRFRWRERQRLGEVVIAEVPVRAPGLDAVRPAVVAYVRRNGLAVLPWHDGARRLCDRVNFLARSAGDGAWPDWSEAGLLATLEEWLAPMINSAADPLGTLELRGVLAAALDYRQRAALDQLAPEHFTAPTGSQSKIDYAGEFPAAAVKLTELYGLSQQPTVGRPPVALVLHLLSPAARPVQITRDLPGFWHGSYQLVRAEMRSRYPKHFWPEDPATAAPTRHARPRP